MTTFILNKDVAVRVAFLRCSAESLVGGGNRAGTDKVKCGCQFGAGTG